MENLSRNMGKNVASSNKSGKRSRTLLLVGKNGGVRQVRWVKPLIYLVLLILIASGATAGFFYYSFRLAEKDVRLVKNALRESEKRARDMEKEKNIYMARMVMAESKLGGSSGVGGNEGGKRVKKKKEKAGAELTAATDKTVAGNKPGKDETIQPGPPPAVSAENLVVSLYKKTVKVDFNIKNVDSKSNRVSGHVVVVLKTQDGGPGEWITMPGQIELVSGKPTGKQIGEKFSISRFKSVDFKVRNIDKPNRFTTATVFIFTREGEPMLEKDFPITIQ